MSAVEIASSTGQVELTELLEAFVEQVLLC